MPSPLRVTIWNEYRHEKKNPIVAAIYPDGIHETIAAFLRPDPGLSVRTATLDEPDHGLPESVLKETDVLIWWGHVAHDKERLWNVLPSHPITQGIPTHFEIPVEEMYGEPFGIPTPDELLFISWFSGGEVFRSGCTWQRGHGRVFYFRPGHETFPSYHQPEVQKVITNAVHWARPTVRIPDSCPPAKSLEPRPGV